MLQKFHDKIQGLAAGVIAVLIALTFALWGVQNYLHSGSAQFVAKVNGNKITEGQFQLAYEQAKRMEMLKMGQDFSFDQKNQAELKKEVLQNLIKQEVTHQALLKMGLGISKAQLWGAVMEMPIFQVHGRFSLNNFQQMIQKLFFSEQAFFEGLESSYLQVQLEKGIGSSGFVLPNEVELVKRQARERRDFGYFLIAPEHFLSTIKLSEDAIEKYYNEHQSDYLLPEKISLQYVELSSSDLQRKIKLTPLQLKQYYQSHLDSYSSPRKWQVTKVLLPLAHGVNPKVLEEAKMKMDEIALQLKNNQDLVKSDPRLQVSTTWLMRSAVPVEVASQLDKLTVGQVSTIYRTKDGYNLIKVLAKQEPQAKSYEQVAEKVKAACEHQQLVQMFSEASDRLSDLVYTNSDSLESAVQALGLKLQTTELFTRFSNKTGILANNRIFKAAFSEPILKQRYNSNLIEIEAGKVVVLRIKDYIPEKLPPLTEVRNHVVEKLRQSEAQAMVSSFADEVLTALNSGKDQLELARQHGLVWHRVAQAKYGDKSANAKLIEQVFELARPKDKPSHAAITHLGNEIAIVRLEKVTEDSSDKIGAEEHFIKSLPEILGQYDYQTLLNSFMDQAKIEIIEKSVDERSSHEIYE